jgi:predicted unusual protein kinase regulating ubiquinone biosynthesis (AarF/ABC1/UbiB family)
MGLAISADRLKRYAGMARLFYKYGSHDLVRRAGLEDALLESDRDPDAKAANTPADPEAARLADDLERLGPAYIKLGQLLSTRSDLLPPEYLDALARLQDRVEPFSFSDVEQIVQQELGVRLSKGFSSFDPTPIAAASLGQVHRATLRDGRAVAVKVQRPEAREHVASDLAAFADVAEFLDRHTSAGRIASFSEIVEEFRRTILEELDYRREAQNLTTLRANLASFPRIVVPAPIADYSSGRVLTMEYVAGTKITELHPVVRVDLNPHGLVEDLFHAYLRQIVIDGFFHADPHPGNVLITDDGRLALIDLGMVSRLSAARQAHLLKLLLSVADGRADQAVEVAIQIGRRLEHFDRAAAERDIADLVTRYKDATLQDVQAGAVIMQLSRIAGMHGLRLPSELTLLGKTLLNLDEIARTLAPGFDASESIRRNAASLMQERMRRSMSIAGGFAALTELRSFAEALPGRLNRVMDAVSTNEFKLKMEVIDEGALIEGFQKIANRIALGLVLAALIVGAAMLMQVRTSFTIFGYPGLAMLLFIAAAGGGLWMAISILTGDRPTRRHA